MRQQDKNHVDNFTRRARMRIERLQQSANELTKELDLSDEASYEVLAMIHKNEIPVYVEHEKNDPLFAISDTSALELEAMPIAPTEGRSIWRSQRVERLSGIQRNITLLVAMVILTVLVGSMIVVLKRAQQSNPYVLGDAHPSGMYITTTAGVYRLGEPGSKIVQQWSYKLNAPETDKWVGHMSSPAGFDFATYDSRVDTPAVVAGDVMYFGGNEDDITGQLHHYLYAMNTKDGSLRWRYEIDGGGTGINGPIVGATSDGFTVNMSPGKIINGPLLGHDMLYINVASSSSAMYVIALRVKDGSMAWTYKYQGNIDYPPDTGMGALANGLLYVTNGNTLFTLNAQDGNVQWSLQVPSQKGPGVITQQGLQIPQFVDGVLYVAYMVTYDNGTAKESMHAFSASSRKQLWHTQQMNGFFSASGITSGVLTLNVDNGDGNNGQIIALSTADGSQLWHVDSQGFIPVAQQEVGGIVFVKEMPAQRNYSPTRAAGRILAYDLHSGSRLWSYDLPHENSYVTNDRHGKMFVVSGIVYAGTRSGQLYALDASNGSLLHTYTLPDSNATWELLSLLFVA